MFYATPPLCPTSFRTVDMLLAILAFASILAHPIWADFSAAVNEAKNDNAAINVLIAAGSHGYADYRHQADAAHAYQVVIRHGIPKSRVVTMLYDDIAYNIANPTKGVIINRPNGPNVYKDLAIDYRRTGVTKDAFLAILQGNASAVLNKGSGRVLNSGPSDHIFVFLVGHGGAGIFAFASGGYLFAEELNRVLIDMHQRNKFAKLVFYFEACKSGSFFENLLPSNINAYAVTAANATHPSYGCYHSNSKHTYLGDQFSVGWMENSESTDIRKENLLNQYQVAKKRTTMSEVQQYGALEINLDTVSEYQGQRLGREYHQSHYSSYPTNSIPMNDVNADAVDSSDVPIFIEMHKLKMAESSSAKEEIFQKLNGILENRLKVISTVKAIFLSITDKLDQKVDWDEMHIPYNYNCYRPVVDKFHEKCFDLIKNEYAIHYLHKFVTLCEHGVNPATIVAAIENGCSGAKVGNV